MSKLHSSPWGQPQVQREVAPGIITLSTAGHGGYYLDSERDRLFRHRFPQFTTYAGGPWFEEDCDWAAVVIAFHLDFDDTQVAAAIDTARGCVQYGRGWSSIVAHVDGPNGESLRRRYRYWLEENSHKFMAGSIWAPVNGFPNGSWMVCFKRISDGAVIQAVMPEYPTANLTECELRAAALEIRRDDTALVAAE